MTDVTDVTSTVCDLSADFSGGSDSDSREKSPKISQCGSGSGPTRPERPEGPAPGASPEASGTSPTSKGAVPETQILHSHSGSPRSAQMTQMPQIPHPQSLCTSVSETLSEDAVSVHANLGHGAMHNGERQERQERHGRQSEERDLDETSPGARVPKTERQIPSEPSHEAMKDVSRGAGALGLHATHGDETSPWWCNRESGLGHNGDVEVLSSISLNAF